MTSRNTRSLVALLAAYALALQAVIAGLTLGTRSGEAALFTAGGLCLTGHQKDHGQPGDPMPCCGFSACCTAGADAATLPCAMPALGIAERDGATLALPPAMASRAFAQRPHQPRAPPAA